MGTHITNLEKFRNLFEKFEKGIENTTKFSPKNLYEFAKYYLKHNSDYDVKDAKNLKRKIERWKENIKDERKIQSGTIEQLKDFIKFLDEEYLEQELLYDEYPEYWFD